MKSRGYPSKIYGFINDCENNGRVKQTFESRPSNY